MAPEIVVRTPVTTEIEALLHSWDLFSQVDVACLTLDRWRLVFGEQTGSISATKTGYQSHETFRLLFCLGHRAEAGRENSSHRYTGCSIACVWLLSPCGIILAIKTG